MRRGGFAFAIACALASIVLLACGETRRSLGEECIRDDDCLSGVCASRSCVSAPSLVTGASNPPPDERPRIPSADAKPDVSGDAGADG